MKTGIANALSYAAGGTVLVLKDSTGNYAQVVVCQGAASTVSTSSQDQIFVTSGAETSADTNGKQTFSYTAIVNGVSGKPIVSYQSLNKGALYFTKDYATNGNVNTAAETIAPITALTDIAYAGGALTVAGSTNASYLLSANVAIYLCNVTTAGTTAVSQITADTAAAMTYANNDDLLYLVPTSSTDSSIAAIYIYQTSNGTVAALTYTNTDYVVYSDVALTVPVVTGSLISTGATLYIKTKLTDTNNTLVSTTVGVAFTNVTPPKASTHTAGVYSFTMPATTTALTATVSTTA